MRYTAILAALVVLLAAGSGPAGHTDTPRQPNTDVPAWVADILEAKPQDCDWQREYTGTIAALGADPARFRVSEDTRLYGRVRFDERLALINPTTPCRFVADTVRHEWMHLQQARAYGDADGVRDRYGTRDHTERVADCGARILGSTTTPYVDADFAHTAMYVGPCRPTDIREARHLIAWGTP
ncbi:hypothetical protein [Haloechinothrix salitolerans]|uniref:SprT-like family protein n=1 Tax=Haloechinothrix salitolerans TaxID=926830 RepID=A0ABW2C4V0_9PSEU